MQHIYMQDQRILRALVMKGELRESQIATQLEAERARDKEKHDMELKREALLKEHQKYLANSRRGFEKKVMPIRRFYSIYSLSHSLSLSLSLFLSLCVCVCVACQFAKG